MEIFPAGSPSLLAPFLDHLWQSTAFGGLMAVAALALRKNRAAVRFWLWLAASMKFLVPYALLMEVGMFVRKQPVLTTTAPTLQRWPAIQDAGQAFFTPTSAIVATVTPVHSHADIWFAVTAAVVWACGFLFVAVRWLRQWRAIRSLVRNAKPIDLGLPIATVSAAARLEPGVFGIFRPVLFLPEGISERLTPEQMQPLFAHEMCHVRRRDNLWAAVHVLVEAIFWFHPLVWWLGARMMAEREAACDESVLQSGAEAETYATSVLEVCRIYAASPMPAIAGIAGADLKQRVLAIASQSFGRSLSPGKKLALALSATGALATPIVFGLAFGQANSAAGYVPTLTFDVASIKEVEADKVPMFGGRRMLNGRSNPLHDSSFKGINMTVNGLVTLAYGISDYRISGSPEWAGTMPYMVEAKGEDSASDLLKKMPDAQAKLEKQHMLQALLADRFQLKAHWETRQLSVYALVLTKNGPRFGPRFQVTPPMSGDPDSPGDTDPFLKAHGEVPESLSSGSPDQGGGAGRPYPQGCYPDNCKSDFIGQSMKDLCDWLRTSEDKEVVDQTGLTGKYDVTLSFLPNMDFDLLSLEQIGMKLEQKKAPVEVLVIDHVEKPSPN
jgi:uncharacterized protein (TIGR03435 family)